MANLTAASTWVLICLSMSAISSSLATPCSRMRPFWRAMGSRFSRTAATSSLDRYEMPGSDMECPTYRYVSISITSGPFLMAYCLAQLKADLVAYTSMPSHHSPGT